ncbi:hypothetical protein ACFCQI_04640 [Rhodanobacter sp. FW102-FHT14D06]|uniref:Uncharacterized protein n=2 Tax=unclassified Rhodanobacter TaxID=2621553 RepID=A0AB74UW87_9GAMM
MSTIQGQKLGGYLFIAAGGIFFVAASMGAGSSFFGIGAAFVALGAAALHGAKRELKGTWLIKSEMRREQLSVTLLGE